MKKWMKANAELSKFCRDYMALKKDLPIRPSEMGVLNIVTQLPGPHTPLMISEVLGVSKSMVAAHLSALMKNGYLEKQPCSVDRRSCYILPTEKAQALVRQANRKTELELTHVQNQMGKDRFALLVELIGEAHQALSELPEDEAIASK